MVCENITASYFSIQSKLRTLRPYFEEWEKRLLTLAGIAKEDKKEKSLKLLLDILKLEPELIPLLKEQLDAA